MTRLFFHVFFPQPPPAFLNPADLSRPFFLLPHWSCRTASPPRSWTMFSSFFGVFYSFRQPLTCQGPPTVFLPLLSVSVNLHHLLFFWGRKVLVSAISSHLRLRNPSSRPSIESRLTGRPASPSSLLDLYDPLLILPPRVPLLFSPPPSAPPSFEPHCPIMKPRSQD